MKKKINNLKKIDKKTNNIFKNKKILLIIGIIIVTIFAIIIRLVFFDVESGDYKKFLEEWFYQLKDNGGIFALGKEIGDYNIPYLIILALLTYIPIKPLYSIKIISCIFDIIGAIFASLIVLKLLENKEKKNTYAFYTYSCILMLTTVILNSAAWAQCDFIYVSFELISIYMLLKKKFSWSFIFLGIAFAFKIQTVFIFPLYILLYFRNKEFNIFNFLLIPIINIICCIPAIIMGRSLISCMMIYINQTGTYSNLSLNFPNLYSLFDDKFNNLTYVAIALTIAILGLLIFNIINKKYKISNKSIINLGLLINFICVYFLPRMHERYNFLAEILIVVVLFSNEINFKNFKNLIVIEASAVCGYLTFLIRLPKIYIKISSIFLLIVLIKFGIDTINQLKKENNEIENPAKTMSKHKE